MYSTLQKYLHHKIPARLKLGFIALLPVLALISWLCLGGDSGATTEHPGGQFLEMSYWATAFGAVLLSFMMMELLFRSRETRILAPFPVPPLALFVFQMRRVFGGIGISSLAYAAFWAPQLVSEPVIAGLCIFLWPFGLSLCAAIASAVILYAGESAIEDKSKAASGAMTFSMAPAVALAVSLVTTLLLKLLAEALLKPGFADAAWTATGIVLSVFAVTLIYAARLYKRRYYAILANFMDTDLIVLNASYDFLDDKEAKALRSADDIESVIKHSLRIQFKRRYPMTTMLVVTFGVVFALVLWGMPHYLQTLCVPCFTVIPCLILAKPWAAFRAPEFETDLNAMLPVSDKIWNAARLKASLRIMVPLACFLSLCVALPAWIHLGWLEAVYSAGLSLVLCLGVSCLGDGMARRFPHYATPLGYGLAAVFMGLGILISSF